MSWEDSRVISDNRIKINNEESDVPRKGQQSVASCRESGVSKTRPVRPNVNTWT
jgi:hypothetical protein